MKKICIILCYAFIISCTVKIPDIRITGEKTALENQVMGEYAKIKEDAWMVASERGSGNIRVVADRRDAVEAVRDREFYKDDVNELKIKGVIGENQQGMIEFVDITRLQRLDDVTRNNAVLVLEKENKARMLIMQRIIETDVKFNSDPGVVYSSFFSMNLSESPPRTFYRNNRGDWVRK